jgi:hypothetical protein
MSGVTALKSKSETDWNKCCLYRTEKKGEDLTSPPTHYSCSKDNDGYYMIQMLEILSRINHTWPSMIVLLILLCSSSDEILLLAALFLALSSNNPVLMIFSIVPSQCFFNATTWRSCVVYARKNFQHLNFSKPWKISLINDENLLTVLSGGDVVAQELKHHYSCLTALNNIERVYLLTIENQDDRELSQEREVQMYILSCFQSSWPIYWRQKHKLIVFRLADPVSRNSDLNN